MKRCLIIISAMCLCICHANAQIAKSSTTKFAKFGGGKSDTTAYASQYVKTNDANEKIVYTTDSLTDTIPAITLRDVNIIYFKTDEERMMYYKYKSRIQIVMPYVKVAKQLYAEMKDEKENDRRMEFHHYRKDVEKEMRAKFETELKNLTIGQGEMLFKLINRETGNNAYNIIKDVKGPFTAWFYQQVGKHYGYNLKDNYDPNQEKLIEYIIKEMGPAYIAGT